MKKSAGFEKIEWAFDHQSAWKALRLHAMGGRPLGKQLPQGLLDGWKREAAVWEAQLDAVRVFSLHGAERNLSIYDAQSGRRTASVAVLEIARGRKGWPDGDLGSVLAEFERLVPLAPMWAWRMGGGAQSLFPLARPTAWPLLLSLQLFSPLARALASLGKAPNVFVTGFGLVDDKMELSFLPPKALPKPNLTAVAASPLLPAEGGTPVQAAPAR